MRVRPLRFREVVALLLLAPAAAVAESPRYGEPERLATLDRPAVDESSGLAVSRRRDDLFWTHNDSGDGPKLYAFHTDGSVAATFRVDGADAVDWEDMASYRRDGRARLLVGDIGDNRGRRDHLTLYAVREPKIRGDEEAVEPLPIRRKVPFHLAGGPADCEALAVHPSAERILLLTKRLFGGAVHRLPLFPETSQPTTERVATVTVPLATALDVSPDGRRAVVGTYGPAYIFRRAADEPWSAAFAADPAVVSMPDRRQGETICCGADGRTLYLTSEKRPTPLWRVPPR